MTNEYEEECSRMRRVSSADVSVPLIHLQIQ